MSSISSGIDWTPDLIENLQQQCNDIFPTVIRLQEDVRSLSAQNHQLEEESYDLHERLAAAEDTNDTLQRQVTLLQEEKTELEREQVHSEQKARIRAKSAGLLQEELSDWLSTAQVALEEKSKALSECARAKKDLEEGLARARQTNTDLQSTLRKLETSLDRYKQDHAAVCSQLEREGIASQHKSQRSRLTPTRPSPPSRPISRVELWRMDVRPGSRPVSSPVSIGSFSSVHRTKRRRSRYEDSASRAPLRSSHRDIIDLTED